MIQQLAIAPVSRPMPSPEARLDAQFDVIRQMLDDMETTTHAGQAYVMRKVVAFLEGELDRRRSILVDRRLSMVARWVQELEHQASRVMPDAREFSRRADHLLVLLASTD